MISVARARLAIHVPCLADVQALYDNKTPTVRKVIKSIRADAQNGDENTIVLYMKQFINSMTHTSLQRFIQFCTGASIICMNKITLYFKKTRGVGRIAFARTWPNTLAIHNNYASFEEFRLPLC